MKDSSSEFKPSTIDLLRAAGKAEYIIQGTHQKKTRSKKTGYVATGTASRRTGASCDPSNRPRSMWDSIPILPE